MANNPFDKDWTKADSETELESDQEWRQRLHGAWLGAEIRQSIKDGLVTLDFETSGVEPGSAPGFHLIHDEVVIELEKPTKESFRKELTARVNNAMQRYVEEFKLFDPEHIRGVRSEAAARAQLSEYQQLLGRTFRDAAKPHASFDPASKDSHVVAAGVFNNKPSRSVTPMTSSAVPGYLPTPPPEWDFHGKGWYHREGRNTESFLCERVERDNGVILRFRVQVTIPKPGVQTMAHVNTYISKNGIRLLRVMSGVEGLAYTSGDILRCLDKACRKSGPEFSDWVQGQLSTPETAAQASNNPINLIELMKPSTVAEILTQAMSYCGYWCEMQAHQPPPAVRSGLEDEFIAPEAKTALSPGGVVTFCVEGQQQELLTLERVKIGLDLMARNYRDHFANAMGGGWDAETSDVLLQLCLLGDVVYG